MSAAAAKPTGMPRGLTFPICVLSLKQAGQRDKLRARYESAEGLRPDEIEWLFALCKVSPPPICCLY
jgi:hypothetical protein